MPELAASTQVHARNGIGRFIAECEVAATRTVEDLIEDGANKSQEFAPDRSGALKESIHPVLLSRTSGQWVATAPYAMAQEEGARRHPIVGSPNLAFFWEKHGRDFVPASALFPQDPTRITVVDHPGNPGTHFLRRGYDVVKRKATEIARKNYPG